MALQTIIVVAVAIAIVWFRSDSWRSARRDFHKTFDVRLEQADMGCEWPRSRYEPDHLLGWPVGQALCAIQRGKPLHRISEYEKAHFRGQIRRRDHYQATLYMGMLKKKHPTANVEALLLYADERRTEAFDPDVYRKLPSQRAECLALLDEAGL
ncbi:MAG: hypothetical protein CMP08_08365 [Xanthomonadales bacterium]|nr:hypothetical protein [Xanthomonadales bacterium]